MNKNNNKTVNRFDVMESVIDFHSIPFKRNADGFLQGDAIVTNVGVFTYRDSEGNEFKELRPPEEVFNNFSLDSLKMIPITNDHPAEKVDINNIKDLQVGMTGNSIFADYAYAISTPIKITDEKAISDVISGVKMSLSCGYSADLEMTSGNWLGQHYDAIQRNIRYNHVAIVENGRAGDLAKIVLRKDSSDAVTIINKIHDKKTKIDHEEVPKPIGGENMMKKIILDGVEYEADLEVIKEMKLASHKADKINENFVNFKKEIEDKISKIEADRDTFKDENEKLKKQIEEGTTTDADIQAAVAEKISLVDTAKSVEVELKDEMSNQDIKKAVVAKLFPNADFKDKDEVYVNARFDAALEIIKDKKDEEEKKDTAKGKSEVFTEHKKDEETSEGDNVINYKDAREKYIKDLEDGHKTYPGSASAK